LSGCYRNPLIAGIAGRGISLQTNTNQSQGEAPAYGWVVERSFSNTGDRQSTTLLLSDARGRANPL
jgi:hypothetical protein